MHENRHRFICAPRLFLRALGLNGLALSAGEEGGLEEVSGDTALFLDFFFVLGFPVESSGVV